ncbi:MAG TPA: hypothetical protein VJ249_08740 [Candidatus Bathyarchaeia archaeon]|nr:hypothetical protein [Candidatus Bathyarchaeia archaeon]
MSDESEKFIRPIRNASAPGTLAALSLAALRLGIDYTITLKLGLTLAAIMFLISALFIFFYSLYPTWRKLWTGTAISFLLGLLSLVISTVALLIAI